MSRRASIGAPARSCRAACALVPAAAQAAEFTVNATGDHAADACDGTDCTVRDAIAAANAAAGADTITVPAGTYALSARRAGRSPSPVTISGPATSQPTAILDAAYSNRIFDVAATASAVTISHLRVTRGQSPDLTGGSGLLQRGGTVTLDHDVFDALSNNLSGGALPLQSGTLNVTDTEVRDTHAFRGGGLFVAGGTANVDRTLWLDNDGTTGGGGAIYNGGGTLTVTNSTFAANTANSAHGGAIYAAASTALKNVTFEANTASGNGGGGSALWVGRHHDDGERAVRQLRLPGQLRRLARPPSWAAASTPARRAASPPGRATARCCSARSRSAGAAARCCRGRAAPASTPATTRSARRSTSAAPPGRARPRTRATPARSRAAPGRRRRLR